MLLFPNFNMELEVNQLELFPLKRVGIETGFSPYPFHTLSKKEGLEIEIKEINEKDNLQTIWEVSPNTKYGQPGILAYKIDTLVVNRKIDELRPNVPRIIKLGSLREICKELGITEGQNTQDIKKALHQNASAYITANIYYKTKNNEEHYMEYGATRYDVIFTGKVLPDGKKADAVYIVLHEVFHDFIDKVQTRPLDYDYLKNLPPTAQRFYELISTQIYSHIKNKLPCAKLRYSEFCLYAPLTRYFDYEQVKKQMYKIHKPHRESGYIESVDVEKTTDENGKDDWVFSYRAGERAKREYRIFNLELRKTKKPDSLVKPEKQTDPKSDFLEDEQILISEMKAFGVTGKKAESLTKSHREAVEREIQVFPYRLLGGAIKNISGLFIKAVEEGYEAPRSYLDSLKEIQSKKQFEAERKKNEEKDKARREDEEIWMRADARLNSLPEAGRRELWEASRAKILSSPDYKDATPQQLKILESVMDGFIRSEIIETFIEQEKRKTSG